MVDAKPSCVIRKPHSFLQAVTHLMSPNWLISLCVHSKVNKPFYIFYLFMETVPNLYLLDIEFSFLPFPVIFCLFVLVPAYDRLSHFRPYNQILNCTLYTVISLQKTQNSSKTSFPCLMSVTVQAPPGSRGMGRSRGWTTTSSPSRSSSL